LLQKRSELDVVDAAAAARHAAGACGVGRGLR